MKKVFAFLLLLAPAAGLLAQTATIDTTKVRLNLLSAPSSPAANLLGFATSDIQRPTDVTDLMLSLQNASSNFTVFPTSYALDFSPFWIARARGLTIHRMDSRKFSDVFRQTFVFSIGIRGNDSTNLDFDPANLYQSLGMKFSIIRGRFTEKTNQGLKNIKSRQGEIVTSIATDLNKKLDTDSIYQARKRITGALFIRHGSEEEAQKHEDYREALRLQKERMDELLTLVQQSVTSSLTALEQYARDLKIERTGFFMDFAGGTSLMYIDRVFSNSRVYNAGAWLTFGHSTPSGLSFLGLARYLYNPEKIFADDAGVLKRSDISTFDAGGRAVYGNEESRFRFSGEGIYRSVLNSNTIDPSWRLLLNAEYDLGFNQILTFSFGRDFDGTTTRGGNVIAALNFVKGLGSKR